MLEQDVTIKGITREHMLANVDAYIRVSADVSNWTEENFLRELPGKWNLSLSIWCQVPIAYCIMSLQEKAIHIHQFMVDKDYRQLGIGSKLMVAAKGVAAGRLTLKVSPENSRAIQFYMIHGFATESKQGGYLIMSFQPAVIC